MTKFKTTINKTWIFAAATALIIGSSSVMAFALNNNVPENAKGNVIPYTAAANQNIQNQTSQIEVKAEYTVIDLSKNRTVNEDKIKTKLSMTKGITPEQIEEKYNQIIANMTPSEKDISAEQAAACAADLLKKAYKVDFTGYTAEASFFRNPIPNSSNWIVMFKAPQEVKDVEQERIKSYVASVDSVNGAMLDASFYDYAYEEVISKDLNSPAWKEKAEEKVLIFIPENLSIVNSKVVMATPETGVTVVCELSDGTAYAVRLIGDNKDAAVYVYFPNGYDGSMDYKPVIENALG